MKKTVRKIILCLAAAVILACSFAGTPAEAEAAEPLLIDLDLAGMSGTIVYAQIYNLLCDPFPWLGRIIRMAGYYSFYEDTEHGTVYHACVIPDATACCAQGIEFVLAGEFAWPDDYPEAGEDITVTGRLEMYEEDGYSYLHLVDAEMIRNPREEARP